MFLFCITSSKSSFMSPDSVRVLLVEDNPDDAELAIRHLKKHHLANNVVLLKDGEEALDYLFSEAPQPSLILLDIQMPKVNGIEVLQKIKSDPRTKVIPVVILTSSNQHPDIHRCYHLGANSYIVKPLEFDRFVEAIRNLGFYWLLLNQQPC
jgi:two-component system response regulator